MSNYSINIQIPDESDKRDATYYDQLQQKLGQSVWIEQVRFLHQEHCAEVEFALAPLYTNIVIRIDTRKSTLKVASDSVPSMRAVDVNCKMRSVGVSW